MRGPAAGSAPSTPRCPATPPREPDAASRPFVGEPRPFPPGWDDGWQGALLDWMAVENLEERAAAPGWIDPRVLEVLRRRAAAR